MQESPDLKSDCFGNIKVVCFGAIQDKNFKFQKKKKKPKKKKKKAAEYYKQNKEAIKKVKRAL